MTPTARAEKILSLVYACIDHYGEWDQRETALDDTIAQIEEAERERDDYWQQADLTDSDKGIFKVGYAEGFRAGEESAILKSEKSFMTGFRAAREKALAVAIEALIKISKWHEGDPKSGMGWNDRQMWGKHAADALAEIEKMGEGK